VSAGSIDYQKQFFKQAAASVKLGFLSIADTDRHLRNLLKGRNRFSFRSGRDRLLLLMAALSHLCSLMRLAQTASVRKRD
jgi:hypothetical protein